MWSMKHTSTFTVSLFFLFAEAVYFSHRKPELCLHVPAGSGTTVGRMYAYLNKKDWCGIQQDKSDVIAYYIIGEHDLFTINSSGWIFLKTSVTENLVGPVSFDVSASCTPTSDTVITATTQVTVTFHSAADTQLVTDQINPNISDSTIDHVCFSHISDDSSFAVEENTKDVVIGRLNTCWQDRKYDRTYKVEKPKSRFNIDPETSEVKLIKQLDRESLGDDKGLPNNISGVQPLKIICEMKIDGVIRTSERHRINISVLDVNDNPPRFHYHNGSQHITKDVEIQTDTAQQSIDDIEEVVEDIDASNSNNTHELRVLTDPLNVCKPNLHCPLSPKLANTVCRFRIHLQNLDIISANLYRCEVAVIDTEFVKPDDTLMNNSATIVVNIHKPVSGAQRAMSLKSTLTLNFYRNATRLGRLYTFNEDMRTNTRYTLTDIVFSITPRLGIVYVDNTDAIPAAPDRYSMSVGQSDGPDIMIDIVLHGTRRQADYCEEGCSGHDSTRSCTGACGLGLTSGGCIMRGSERNTGMSKYYGTCTPDVATCPDLTCDELEDTFPLLCPQDCTTEVIGAYLPNKNYNPPRGIGMAVSPCWCEEDYEIVCTCMSVLHENFTITDKDVDSPAPSPLDRTKLSSKVSTDGSVGYSVEKKAYGSDKLHPGVDQTSRQLENGTHQTDTIALVTEQPPICDQVCGVAIGFGLTVFLLITFSLFMLWFTKRKNDRRKTNMKYMYMYVWNGYLFPILTFTYCLQQHVGSVVSISALPSDYQDDRERRPSYSSDHWSQKGLIYSTTQMQCIHDDNGRWEVPREMLTLEKTIGEGEFGLVVKAKMAVMDGDQKKNVAIKMLKHCSTQIEEQDLWSEYNLLKDLCHPNVIRLIGACTTDGPFYLVVEFCRHGCLLKYLRRSRLEENGYINSGMRFKSPNVKEQTDPELMGDLLTMRDLLSFSWQIAKGMSYLSEIKLVHRDLAARNILVASNRVLKISDFGLTRDVYEADTYMKKSKGRIPVKWLAPESLYAQIYTTRSDIWSYGIVLWEIVTLGAPPYPGIPPERLYNLLIGGYRMDRPENCLDEMYAVMQKCWKIDATDRPSFAALAIIFDRILQEKTGYLDLSQTIVNTSNMYNKCFTSKCNENEQEDNLSSQYDEISHNSGSEDSIDKMNIFTVCNETYHTDDYLTPTPANKQPRHSDNVLPLLETRKRGREENVKTDQISQEVGISAKKFNLDDHLHEISLNDMARSDGHIRGVVLNEDTTNSEQSLDHGVTDSNSRDNEHSHIMPNITAQGPMLKKKSENSLPTIRYTKNIKNKHVIYPSEHVALLTDGGNAMCVKESDYVEQETSQC